MAGPVQQQHHTLTGALRQISVAVSQGKQLLCFSHQDLG